MAQASSRWRGYLGAGLVMLAVAGAGVAVLPVDRAEASVGESFMAIPGLVEGRAGKDNRGWLRIEAHYWPSEDTDIFMGRNRLRGDKATFSGPPAPQHGAGTLALAIDKRNPLLRKLMQACAAGTVVPQLRFRESSQRARSLSQIGMRPDSVPEFFEYELKQVKFAGCPVVAEAPEQAVVVTFQDIAWTNYAGPADGVKLQLTPASLQPIQTSGQTKAFVLSWFAVAHDVSDSQCPVVNAKPTEADFYALKPKEEADRIRAERPRPRAACPTRTSRWPTAGQWASTSRCCPGSCATRATRCRGSAWPAGSTSTGTMVPADRRPGFAGTRTTSRRTAARASTTSCSPSRAACPATGPQGIPDAVPQRTAAQRAALDAGPRQRHRRRSE